MSYRIEKGESLAAALGRIGGEEMNVALAELAHRDKSNAVHNARKAIKRLRALLRSLRVVFPKELFHAENQRLAEAGRKISPLRDIQVQLRTLGKLHDTNGRAGIHIRQKLLRQEETFARQVPDLRRTVRQILGDSRETVESWPLDKTTPMALIAGLKHIYKQGRSAFKNACKDPVAENLHELRKKAKALGYGLELIDCLSSKKTSKMMKRCGSLEKALGDDHDLFMVSEALKQENNSQAAPDYKRLAQRISARRARLQKKAFKCGKKVYSEKPRAFASRLNRHLKKKI
jgi:CHAD domain-containing protein